MLNVQNPSTSSRAVDFFKQMANKLIDTGNNVAVKYGNGAMTPRFETIADKQANDYQKVVEMRRLQAAGSIKDDPRNNPNFIYNGAINPTATPIPLGKSGQTKITPIPLGRGTATKVPLKRTTATPTPTPTAPYVPNFDFTGYKISKPGFEGKKIPQPSPEIAKIIYEMFAPSNEATPAAAVAWSENGTYNPNAVGINNDYNRSTDTGIFQINSNTFNGLLQRRPQQMKAIGAITIEDMKDPRKNAQVAKLIRLDEEWSKAQPWSRWYGWQEPPLGKGVNLQEMIAKLNKMLASKKK